MSLEGLAPGFSSALQRLIAAAPGRITISSGYRSPERQQQLWDQALAKYGDPEVADNWVARPGKSNHNHGIAADLGFENDEVRSWVHANAGKFGLHFPMGHEPWHIEPVDGGDSAGHTAGGKGGEDMEGMVGAPQQFSLEQRLDAALKIIGSSPVKAGTMTIEGDVGEAASLPDSLVSGGKATSVKEFSKLGRGGQVAEPGEFGSYAKRVMAERYGWGEEDFAALVELWNRESGDPEAGSSRVTWDPTADNPTSTASGIAQFLDGTWAGTGIARTNDPYRQIDAGLIYIDGRFGNPRAALAHHDAKNWY